MSLLPPFIGHCCLCRRPRVTVVAIAGTAARASLSPRKAAGVLPRYATGELKQPATWHSQRNFEAKKVLPLSSQRAGCKIEGRKTSTGAVEVTVTVFTLNSEVHVTSTKARLSPRGTSTVPRPTVNSPMKDMKNGIHP